jgi:rhodanese-related sulfurtransferase
MNRIFRALFSLLAAAALSLGIGCSGRPAGATIDQAAVAKLFEDGSVADVTLLDVRTGGEFGEGRLPGAININIAAPDFTERLGKLDKSKKIVIYCRTKNRSARVYQMMTKMSFEDVQFMPGGFLQWARANRPVEK